MDRRCYGMIEGTTVENFQCNCGGWNCRHQLVPVADAVVPASLRAKFGKSTPDEPTPEPAKQTSLQVSQEKESDARFEEFIDYMRKGGTSRKEVERTIDEARKFGVAFSFNSDSTMQEMFKAFKRMENSASEAMAGIAMMESRRNSLIAKIENFKNNPQVQEFIASFTSTERNIFSRIGDDISRKEAEDAYKKQIQELEKIVNIIDERLPKKNLSIEMVTTEIQNAEMSVGKWSQRGQLKIVQDALISGNGQTDHRGRITLNSRAAEAVISGITKIKEGKVDLLTEEEAQYIGTLWHEITHNRNKHGYQIKTQEETDAYETINEFVARRTLPEFYSSLGIKDVPYPQFMTSRPICGYDKWVKRLYHLVEKCGLSLSVLTEKLTDICRNTEPQKAREKLPQALIDAGLKKVHASVSKEIVQQEILPLIFDEQGYSRDGKVLLNAKYEYLDYWLKERGYSLKIEAK